jgi:hypothetical protein
VHPLRCNLALQFVENRSALIVSMYQFLDWSHAPVGPNLDHRLQCYRLPEIVQFSGEQIALEK